jgi:large subunit ribosomal protein L31
MKENTHPAYGPVLFKDGDHEFIINSAVQPKEKAKAADGKSYPVFALDTSSKTHSAYTGERKMSTKGRVKKFQDRYGRKSKDE